MAIKKSKNVSKIVKQFLPNKADQLHALLDIVPDIIFMKNRNLEFILNNKAHLEMLGVSKQKDTYGKTDFDFFPKEMLDKENVIFDEQKIIETGKPLLNREREIYLKSSRKKIWVSDSKVPLKDLKGNIIGIIGIARDITARKKAEKKLKENELRFRSVFATSSDAIFLLDLETGAILDVNSAGCNLYGYSHNEMIKLKIFDISTTPEKARQRLKNILNNAEATGIQPIAIHKKKNGDVFSVEIHASLFELNSQKVITASIRDITERKRAVDKITYLSFHDQLTGLYNRRFFFEEIKRLDTKRQLPLAIIMADVDGLKYINDTYGHEKGNQLLIAASKIIKNSCRKEDIVARWGGDEFIILLPKTSYKDAQDVVFRIMEACKIQKLDDKNNISISLGLSTKKEFSENIEEIIENADKNMYMDKAQKKKE